MSVTSAQCLARFGEPDINFERKHMVLWDVPQDINNAIPALPNKIYCNKIMPAMLEKAFRNIIDRGLAKEFKTWDGCFNIRKKRGLSTMSLHSWAVAVDLNAAWNQLAKEPTLSKRFVECFLAAGFEWGGLWIRKDGMHFQIATL
jgi:hypothetical protein